MECTLVEKFKKSKDQVVFGKIYELFYRHVFDYIKLIVKDTEVAFDLTQETFITVHEKLETLRENRTFRLWVFRIAKNKTMRYFRNAKAHRRLEPMQNEECEDTSEAENRMNRESQYVQLLNFVQLLSPEERFLIESKYYDNMSIDELVSRTGFKKSAVKMKIHRTRLKIKKMMVAAQVL